MWVRSTQYARFQHGAIPLTKQQVHWELKLGTKFSEDQVHEYLYQQGLEALTEDVPEIDVDPEVLDPAEGGVEFELWRILKARAVEKIEALHQTVRYGRFLGSKVKLPTDSTRPMELDLFGEHEDGLFILELKVDRSAERNAFSELLAYSNYIAGIFPLSGHKDIANVLVANLDNKITRQAFLYDLLINDRNVIVYKPVFSDGTLQSLKLQLHLPSDKDFLHLTNDLLSHDAMSCVVASFDDLEGWFDSEEVQGSLQSHTKEHLSLLSAYTAQLMESEHLHGFCFVRKPWREIPLHHRNSLIVCALNPFQVAPEDRAEAVLHQIGEEDRSLFFESPLLGFHGRLLRLARRAVKDCLTHNYDCELEMPNWNAMVVSAQEVVFTHNFAFRPTGVFREAYTYYLNRAYAMEAQGGIVEDHSVLKINEITNWLGAWRFMEMCGFSGDKAADSEARADPED